jgi:Alpha 1,4-glycosyltransferase conserved region
MGQLFQSFWSGESLSPYEWLSLKSFIDLGHRFDLYTFDPHLDVPAQVRVRNAAELAGREEMFVYQDGFGKGSPAAFANIFRYRLLAERGGWWVDTDVVCLSDAIPEYDQFVARQDDEFVNSAVMRFERRHPIMLRCLEVAAEKGRLVRWGDLGPTLLTQVLGELGATEQIFDPSVCYPIHYSVALDVLRPSQLARVEARLSGSHFLHLWNAMLRGAGVRKSYLPPRGSLLRRLVEQHQIDGWTGEYDESGLSESLEVNARLQAAELRLEAEQRRAGELESALRDCVAAGDRLRTERDALAVERDALIRSTSWRVTAPLRGLRRGLSGAHKALRRR